MGADNGAVDAGLQSLLVAAKRRFECADYPATERLAREALDAAEARHDIASAIEARVWLGAGLAQQGQYATALRWLHDAVDLSDANALPLHACRACNYIAVCHEEIGDFATAVEWYERGLEQARRVGNREVEVYLLSNLADGWVTAGSAHKAMPLLDQAVDAARSVGDQAHEAWCLSARARLRESLAENPSARCDHAIAVEVALRSRSERILAETLRDEGAFLARNGDTAAGIERLTRSLAIATKLDIRREMYRAHEALATVHEQLGEWQSA